MNEKTIHGYTIQKFLGKGGMAEVWYAENRLKKPVAIKIMLTEYLQYPQVIARFETEAQAMVMLDHPNIRQVIDYGEIENRPFSKACKNSPRDFRYFKWKYNNSSSRKT